MISVERQGIKKIKKSRNQVYLERCVEPELEHKPEGDLGG